MKRTERGFAIYGETTDSYGHGVTVQESSAATDRFVWIFVKNPPHLPECEEHRPAFDAKRNPRACSCPQAHLSVEQAIQVRDALDAFIRGES